MDAGLLTQPSSLKKRKKGSKGAKEQKQVFTWLAFPTTKDHASMPPTRACWSRS